MPRLLIDTPNGRTDLLMLKTPQTTLGRALSNDVVLDDMTVSRFHATIDVEGPFFIIKDLCSANGLYHNSRRVHARALASGDTVTIGAYTVRFVAEEDFAEVVVDSPPLFTELWVQRAVSAGRGLQAR